ncbi:hypothetical protein MNV84_03428 [Leishmania braziliensis]|nr:hypothetical protein MNV84_03428 [Leishmania braziliensis]
MVVGPKKVRDSPAYTSSSPAQSLSATSGDRKRGGEKRISERQYAAPGQFNARDRGRARSHCATALLAHPNAVTTVDDQDERRDTARRDAIRNDGVDFVTESVDSCNSGDRSDLSMSHHGSKHSAEIVVEEISGGPISTLPLTPALTPPTTTAAAASDALDGVVVIALGSPPPARREQGGSRGHHKGCERSEPAQRSVTCISDEEDMVELPHPRKRTMLSRSHPSVESSSANTHCFHTLELKMSSQLLFDDKKGDAADEEGFPVLQPYQQREPDLTVHRTSCCFSSLGPLPTRASVSSDLLAAIDGTELKQHLRHIDNDAGPRALHAAPILQVSGLRDFFTYGIQAAMRHYSEHFDGTTDSEEDGACGAMSNSAVTPHLDNVPSPTTLPTLLYDTHQRSTAPRYRNAFLEDSSAVPTYYDNTARNRPRANSCSSSSSSSSAATYDSDVEGTDLSFSRGDKKTSTQKTCLLNPQQTSLFRAPRGVTAARHSPGQGVMADSSWLGATATRASSTNLQTLSMPPSGSAQAADQQRKDGAQMRFREALQHAYQCEDVHRQWRRAQLDKQQEQLLRGVALLQGTTFSSSDALLAELLPSRGRDGRRRADPLRSSTPLQQQQPQDGASSLSLLANCAEAAVERGTETITQQAGKNREAGPAPAQRSNTDDNGTSDALTRLAAEAMYSVGDETGGGSALSIDTGEACLSSSSKATSTPQMDAASKHPLHGMPPDQVQRLRKPLNPFIEALLRHHQDAQRKQRAAQHAEDQAIHARRMYELPVLTEDVVRYAALLLCLRRRSSGGGDMRVTCAASAGGSGMPQPGPAGKELSSSTTSEESAQSPNVAVADPAAALAFGEEGALLYLKYPAPLLRTTSFAVETVRLLKWLRTWKRNDLGVAGGMGGASGGGSSVGAGGVSGGSSSSSKSLGKIGRKRARVDTVKLNSLHGNSNSIEDDNDSDGDRRVAVVASPTPAPFAAASSCTIAEAPAPKRSTVEHVSQQVQHAVELQKVQVKQERRSAFLNFFGAATVTAVATPTPSPTKDAKWHVKAAQSQGDGNHDTEEVVGQTPVSFLAVSESTGRSTGVRDMAAISVGATYGITSSLMPSQLALASHAYQLYCHAWKHAVKTGITPLAVAANAFSSHKAVTEQLRLNSCPGNTAGAAAASNKNTSWVDGAVSRVCAALPFFKEMREEAQRTALGSANNGAYYEDAFGNRLRSARLAKKEQEQRELLLARQRRRAKRKGYFHRDDEDGGLGGRVSDSGASAMLEAMLHPSTTCGTQEQGVGRGKKRRRSTDGAGGIASSNNAREGKGVAKGTQPRVSYGCAAACRDLRPRSRAASSCSSSSQPSSRSSSTASTVSTESDQVEAGVKDELTNIAVVSGPTGSGKTAAVYVAAQLLGFRVVEMNASVRRCSKTVEHLLAELTRSHRLSGLRPGTTGGFNAEEELAKLKQQHAVMMERARAETEATERKAELKRREAVKSNGISAQAVASFFAKSSGRAAVPCSKTAKCAKGKDAAKQVSGVGMVGEVSASATTTTSSPPPPPTTALGTPASVGTLLLFEDADILLGDESAKPFYAAIRDLAHRSKVPIVVTVSSDPAAAQRYDTEPFLALLDEQLQQRHPMSTSPTSVLQPTYWQLCDAAGLNSTMAALEAAQQALQLEVDLGNRGVLTATTITTTAATHENDGSPSVMGDSGESTSKSPVSGTSAASFLSLFASAGGGGAAGSAASAAGAWTNGAGTGVSATAAASGGGGAGGTNTAAPAAASLVTTRSTHILLNPTLVANFFGSQTPFTVVDPLPPAALYAQLLAVGAVELDLLGLDEPATSPGGSDGAVSLSSSLSQQELERMAARLIVRDTRLFLRLAKHLRHHIFGAWNMVDDGSGALAPSSSLPGHSLVTAVQCDAARRTTTDIRYWLNKLQLLLLSLRAGSRAAQPLDAAEAETSSEAVMRKRSREAMETSSATVPAAYRGGNVMREATPRTRCAEHLVEVEFQHCVSLASSEWDSALGRHLSNVAHNEQHSTRYERWFLEDHVYYIADIVEELATIDHPTARVDYTTSLQVLASPLAAAQSARRGRPPSSLSFSKKSSSASDPERKAATTPGAAGHQHEGASPCATQCTRSSGGTGGGMNSAWRSFFAASGVSWASSSSSATSASPALRGVSPAVPRQQALFDCGSSKAAGRVVGAPAPPPLTIPARYEWPPSAFDLRRQACSHAHLRPVELLLPYGAAEAYYGTAAASASTLAPSSIHGMQEPTSALLGHEIPIQFLTRRSVLNPSTGDNGEAEDLGRELPSGVRTTQEERFGVFRRWWCRARKAGALRDSVAGRSAATLEDIIGFGCLLTPSAAATRNVTSGKPVRTATAQ